MDLSRVGNETQAILEKLVGYLNFSSGSSDPHFLRGLDDVYVVCRSFCQHDASSKKKQAAQARVVGDEGPTWRCCVSLMEQKLRQLSRQSGAFEKADQAVHVLALLNERLIEQYLDFHCNLLFHQDDNDVINAFMLGRCCESLLGVGPPWDPPDKVCAEAIRRLNDFLGHRPVAALESQPTEPYEKERIRPVPLYIKGAGAVSDFYGELASRALELLAATDRDLSEAAFFDFDALEELAFDPRAYDFDHPVNRRPNYHFGEWDPHCIDNQGRYRRFVIREVTLRALLDRVADAAALNLPRDELMMEAAAVLACTTLMASGISGAGPDTHDSHTTLVSLIPRIATFRDVFYERLIEQTAGEHGERLRREAQMLRQPFGGARQHLNHYLAKRRASQLEHVQLAKVFARMGYLGAAQRKSDAIPVASARMICRIDCAVTATNQAIANGDRAAGLRHLKKIMKLLQEGIACGAIVDPWNILGFDANFSLFPSLGDSIRDHRVDELVALIGRICDLYSRLWCAASAANDTETAQETEVDFEEMAKWWNQFAAHEVSTVEAESALDQFHAAQKVAKALSEWHAQGHTSGDVGFWAPHVESFTSPKAYTLVIETFLNEHDLVSAMSLLVHWLSQAPEVPLETGESTFHALTARWVRSVVNAKHPTSTCDYRLLLKFFDYLEANADEYWYVPSSELASLGPWDNADRNGEEDLDSDETDDDEDLGLFSAAYEDMVYRGSSEDGIEGSIFDPETPSSGELEETSERIVDRLSFLAQMSRLWTSAISATTNALSQLDTGEAADWISRVGNWHGHARKTRCDLLELIDSLHRQKIPRPRGDHDSMIEYDRHRLLKETLIENVIATVVEVSEAERFLLAACGVLGIAPDISDNAESHSDDQTQHRFLATAAVLAPILQRDAAETRQRLVKLVESLEDAQILYVPMSKGGHPRQIAEARMSQRIVENLAMALPRMGLLTDTLALLDTARAMEQNIASGRGAVTQFDELFEIGFRELVDVLVRATSETAIEDDDADSVLVTCLERITEVALESWLMHSRTLRLSVLERIRKPAEWKRTVAFIERYGGDLFTQHFLALGNVRAILHSGVENWLEEVHASDPDDIQLIDELHEEISLEEAASQLGLILEAVIENYDEYRDYNTTTTQSDRGEMLYTLLDFVRVRVEYDRVAWNLKPVVWAHDVLVQRGRNGAAQIWRRMLAERIGEEATRYQRKLYRLRKKHAMRMSTIANRIGERFLLPMTIDRMRALVRPAVEQLKQPEPRHAFEILEEETNLLMREPSGAGMDTPGWLEALEDEVSRLAYDANDAPWSPDGPVIQPRSLTMDELQEQLLQLARSRESS